MNPTKFTECSSALLQVRMQNGTKLNVFFSFNLFVSFEGETFFPRYLIELDLITNGITPSGPPAEPVNQQSRIDIFETKSYRKSYFWSGGEDVGGECCERSVGRSSKDLDKSTNANFPKIHYRLQCDLPNTRAAVKRTEPKITPLHV